MVSILLQLIVKINTICSAKDEEDAGTRKDVGYNEKIYQIIRYISSNLDQKITLDELEKIFFIDKYYLCHLFKNITGYTVIEYMNYKKILSAKEQLKNGKPISEVWVQLGFLNYSGFYRAFKKIAGMSPQEYMNSSMQRKYTMN
jgi:YesN/AraC family two-component response regulator